MSDPPLPPEPSGPDLSRLRNYAPDAKPPKPERDVNVGRFAAFVAAALVVVVVPWFVFTRIGDSGPAKPARSPGARASSPAPSASPTVNPDAGVYEVVGDVDCVRVRVQPGSDKEVLNCLKPGTRVESDGALTEANGFVWLHIEDPFKGLDGWMATQYLKKASSQPS